MLLEKSWNILLLGWMIIFPTFVHQFMVFPVVDATSLPNTHLCQARHGE